MLSSADVFCDEGFPSGARVSGWRDTYPSPPLPDSAPGSSRLQDCALKSTLSNVEANMNWTGGRLQRHSKNTRSTLADRQKQHFARALTSSKPHRWSDREFIPSFLQHGSPDTPPTAQTTTSPERQTRLEDYQSMAPVVGRLDSMAPKDIKPRRVASPEKTLTIHQFLQPLREVANAQAKSGNYS